MLTRRIVSLAATWMVAAGMLTLTPAFAAQKPKDWNPTIVPADFVSQVDNPYFPLNSWRTMSYSGVAKEGTETLVIEVTGQTKVILGVVTTVVLETARLNGSIIEIAENWFAQDRDGNVWYFGESTRDFANGVELGTAGSWEAGVGGALPGIVMKANPVAGDTYFQEFAQGVAEDMATVTSITRTGTAMGRAVSGVLLTKEWSSLEPNSVEHKSYAPGIGLIREEKGSFTLDLVEVR